MAIYFFAREPYETFPNFVKKKIKRLKGIKKLTAQNNVRKSFIGAHPSKINLCSQEIKKAGLPIDDFNDVILGNPAI